MISSKTRLRLASLILICSLFGMLGCGTRTIFVQPGTVAVTTGWTKGVSVAVPDAKGELTPSVADLPPGTMIQVPQVPKQEGKGK